jgi:DNA-binding response OmpR family regulator
MGVSIGGETDMQMGKHRVLVIDDDERLLKVCQEVLSQSGFTVTTCPDSTQALPILKANPFEAVLLDIRMPGCCGMWWAGRSIVRSGSR